MSQYSIKNILTYTYGRHGEIEQAWPAARWAKALAAQFDAHVDLVVAAQKFSLSTVFNNALISDVISTENTALRESAQSILDEARSSAPQVNTTGEILFGTYQELLDALAVRSRVYDVTVADAEADLSSMRREIITELLFTGGRPVILVPLGADAPSFKHITVAWDGSAPASRALYAALPLLLAAEHVDVVSISGDKDLSGLPSAADAARALQHHGVKAEAVELKAAGGDAALTLRGHAGEVGSGLIVMGAFAQSRMRQLLFGGVTRTLLGGASVPLFLSH